MDLGEGIGCEVGFKNMGGSRAEKARSSSHEMGIPSKGTTTYIKQPIHTAECEIQLH